MSRSRIAVRRRRGLAAATALLALTALSACGDNGDDDAVDAGSTSSASSSPDLTPSASETATEEPSEEPSEPAPRAGGEPIDAADFLEIYQAAVEQVTSANVTMKQTASGLDGQGVVDYTSDPAAMQMTATLGAMGEMEMRLVDNVMYLRLPMLGDKFIAYDLDDPTNPLGGGFADYVDPEMMLTAFAEGIESATYAGEEDVDGEGMDHYTVVTDPSAMLEDLELPEGAPAIDLPETQTIDVWFDGDGYFRRVVTDLGALGTTTLTYDDWGVDVSVEAPPTDQVTTMPGTQTG